MRDGKRFVLRCIDSFEVMDMKSVMKWLEIFVWAASACCFLFLPQEAVKGVVIGLNVCAVSILPALFPFFVLTEYWVRAGYANKMARLAAPFMERVFHLPGVAASALVLGSIGGYPVGARTVAQLYESEHLNKEQAEQALFFCNNAGPAFVLGVLGNVVFQNTWIGILLYVIHLTAAYLTGFLFRSRRTGYINKNLTDTSYSKGIAQNWTQSITGAGSTAILVCTYVLFFSILTQCIRRVIPTTMLKNGIISLMLGAIELAGGAKILADASISMQFKFILAAFLLGFGGLCVMLQSISVIQVSGLSGKTLLLGKLCNGSLSAALAAVLTPFLPLFQPCATMSVGSHPSTFRQSIIMVLLIFVTFRFLKESSGKVENNQI